jgi:hypothetical protein
MSLAQLVFPALVLLALAAAVVLLSWDWRLSIGGLAFQYAGVFVLVAQSWPLEMAVVKLVTGWMAGAVLGMALIGVNPRWLAREHRRFSEVLLRALAAVLSGLLVISLAPRLSGWLPGSRLEQLQGGLLLIGMGLLHLGLTAQPLPVALGLLTVLSGFEILYAVVETSTLVTGLLACVNLGLALVGAYLLLISELEEAA